MTQKESIINFMKNWGNGRKKAFQLRERYNGMFKEIDSFLRGEQWSQANQKKQWQSNPVTNFSHLIQQAKLSIIADKDTQIKLKPLASEDEKLAITLEKVLQSYWDHSYIQDKLNLTKLDSRGFPVGYLKLMYDGSAIVGTKNNLQVGDLKVTTPEPMNIFWDPKAFDYEDLDFIFEVKRVSLEQIKNTAKYNREVVQDIEDYVESFEGAGSDEAGEVLDRDYEFFVDDDGNPGFVLYEIYYRWKPSPSADFKYGVIHTVSKGENRDNPLSLTPLWSKTDCGTKGHPIIPLYEFKHPHEFLGRSTVQLTIDNQKQINKIDAIIATTANQAQNNQKIISQDSGIDPKILAKYGDAAGLVVVTKTDINNSVKYLEPAKISAELVNYKREKKEDIMEVANVTPSSLGQNAGSLTTSSGVSNLINQSQGLETAPKNNYRIFLKHVISRMMELIIKNGKKTERRVDNKDPNKDEAYSFVEFDPSEFKGKVFDMTIDIRMTEAEKQRQKQEVIQLINLQSQMQTSILTPEDIIDLMDFPDKERILANMAERKEKEAKGSEVEIAQLAAMIMAQEITESQDNQDVAVQDMAQIAATEAVKRYKQQQNGIKSGGPAGAAGSAAPQPDQAKSNLGQ